MPFHTNYLHYTWHWFWHWGNGELGNNGIHYLDLCRWGLGVEFPIHVTSSGGRYRYEDDQQTPDTQVVAYEFDGRKSITWEGLSCNNFPDGQKADVIFYGDKGSLRITGSGYSIHDPKGKEIEKVAGGGGDSTHIGNFLAAIRGAGKLSSEIEDGHKSTLLCHLGNIAHRTGRALKCSAKDGAVIDDKEAMTFWKREYEKGWEPTV
jgi:predicted dehydrogenase